MPEDIAVYPWCAKIQWTSLSPVIFGTVTMPRDARLDEVEAAIVALAGRHVPAGFKVIDLLPGALMFVPREEAPPS